jgi:hypothetical protein
MKRKFRYILAGFAAAFFLVAFWPVSSPASPRWEVWVVDQAGHPVQGLTVLMSRGDSSESGENTEQNLLTDQNGYAAFAARNVTISALAAILTKMSPSFATVSAFGQDAKGNNAKGNKVVSDFAYWHENPLNMQSRLIVNASRY